MSDNHLHVGPFTFNRARVESTILAFSLVAIACGLSLMSGCSDDVQKPVLTWACPDPQRFHDAAMGCHREGARFALCAEEARSMFCTAQCVANCERPAVAAGKENDK